VEPAEGSDDPGRVLAPGVPQEVSWGERFLGICGRLSQQEAKTRLLEREEGQGGCPCVFAGCSLEWKGVYRIPALPGCWVAYFKVLCQL